MHAQTPIIIEPPMLRLPQKQSLENQTAAVLREQIAAGAWKEWLPGERSLCELLQVSRYTLRAALEDLRKEGLLQSEQGVGNRIVMRRTNSNSTSVRSQEVGLLVAGEIDILLPTQVMWIDQLRGMLAERGCRLHLFHGRQYLLREPSRALRQVTTRSPHACWILLLAPIAVQKWFQEHKIPCVVAGSLGEEIVMPSCDLDHRAMCRHAAGIFLARGHRYLGLLMQKTRRAGDIEGEAAFIEAARKGDATVVQASHDATTQSFATALKRLLMCSPRPTALLVTSSFHTLTAFSALARMGYRIPEDISVISRDGEAFLSYLLPLPAHYSASPTLLAKTLLGQVLQLLERGTIRKWTSLIMPSFLPGGSLGPAPNEPVRSQV